jgi:hypothetical protein
MLGSGSGDCMGMRLHDLKRELIRGYVEGKRHPRAPASGPKISISRATGTDPGHHPDEER